MFTSLKFFTFFFLSMFTIATAQSVKFTDAQIWNSDEQTANIKISGETSSSLVQILDEVNVFRDQNGFQLLFFAHSMSGIGLPVITPFEKNVDVDSLDDGVYTVRCFALNSDLIDSTVFFSPDSSIFYFPYNDTIPPDSLFILADTTFTVHYTKTAVDGNPTRPQDFDIVNFPNPFNAHTTFSFTVPQQNVVRLHLFDIQGRLVSTLLAEPLPQGRHTVNWDATNFSSGLYFYQLDIGGQSHLGRVALIK